MNRKAFLQTIWKYGLKPLLGLVVILFAIRFLINTSTSGTPENGLLIALLGFAFILFLTFWFIQLFRMLVGSLYERLPAGTQRVLRLIDQAINYLSPFVTGALIVYFWLEDWKSAAWLTGLLLLMQLRDLWTRRKSNAN